MPFTQLVYPLKLLIDTKALAQRFRQTPVTLIAYFYANSDPQLNAT